MRDGIYKNLPLSQSWRAALKSCCLDAERGDIAREKVERAFGLDLKSETRPQFMKTFRDKTEQTESLLPGFSVFSSELTSRDVGGHNSPLENGIIAHARRYENEGVRGGELERKAFMSASKDHMECRRRLIEQTILTERSDSDAKATVIAAQNACNTTDIKGMVDKVLARSPLDLPPARRPIEIDEDLSRINP